MEPTFIKNSKSCSSYEDCIKLFLISSSSFLVLFISSKAFLSGFIVNSPLAPSKATMSSFCISLILSPTPITQGIPKFFATITACEVGPPSLRTIPTTLPIFIEEVSAGVKSSAISIEFSLSSTVTTFSCIVFIKCFPTEIISSALCLKYSSSILANIFALESNIP